MPTELLTLSFDYTDIQWEAAEFDYVESVTNEASGTWTAFRREDSEAEHSEIWPSRYNPAAPHASTPAPANARQLRAGAELTLRQPGFLGLIVLPLRAGIMSDRQIFRSRRDLSPIDSLGYTGGVGLVWPRVSIDFAYVYMRGAFNDSYVSDDSTEFGPGLVEVSTERFVREKDSRFSSHRFYMSTVLRF
jgi:hypothetical protein